MSMTTSMTTAEILNATTVFNVGDAVSYAFNGDCYPDGLVVSVGTGVKQVVTTDTGSRYYRKVSRHGDVSWIKEGGTWTLVKGHTRRWNPSF